MFQEDNRSKCLYLPRERLDIPAGSQAGRTAHTGGRKTPGFTNIQQHIGLFSEPAPQSGEDDPPPSTKSEGKAPKSADVASNPTQDTGIRSTISTVILSARSSFLCETSP